MEAFRGEARMLVSARIRQFWRGENEAGRLDFVVRPALQLCKTQGMFYVHLTLNQVTSSQLKGLLAVLSC